MVLRLWLVLLFLVTATVAQSSAPFGKNHWINPGSFYHGRNACNGLIGDCIDEDEENMLNSGDHRRSLAAGRFISYAAMKKNAIPCNRRGASYYNCNTRSKANPYRRGCSKITNCARDY